MWLDITKKNGMDGIDKVAESRFYFRIKQLTDMGFHQSGTVWHKGDFSVTTTEITNMEVDEWMRKIAAIKRGDKFGTLE